MMTYYLRERSGLPSACVALEVSENAVVYAIAAWNEKADKDNFERGRSRVIAEGRVRWALGLQGNRFYTHTKEAPVRKRLVGAVIPAGEKAFRRVLADIVATKDYPQRVRDGARRALAALEARDAQEPGPQHHEL